jgi:uncharacterized membrane protein YfcA
LSRLRDRIFCTRVGREASFLDLPEAGNAACARRIVYLNGSHPAIWNRLVTISIIVLLFGAGVLTGMINAVAGGGTFLSFGALTLVGVPPVVANATSSITQFPGYITSTLAYWEDFKTFWRGAIALAVASVVGSLLGSWILLQLDNPQFRTLVPWLLLAATALFAAGPYLKPKPRPGQHASVGSAFGTAMQFVTAIYGGFFGAGMGVMMLASLGLSQAGDYHRLNALKNMLAMVIAAVAIIVFVAGGVVAWPQAVVMIPGVAIGGWSGVWIAKRVPQSVMRFSVIAVGLLLAVYYFVK